MVELVTYRARDRRVYNGAYCTDMQREADHTAALKKRMLAADRTAKCTYFPGQPDNGYLVFVNSNMLENPDLIGPPKILTGNFHDDIQKALIEAIIELEKKQVPEPTRGKIYNWKHQKERLVYLGKLGVWHQFSLVGATAEVWCEVLDEDLKYIEETTL